MKTTTKAIYSSLAILGFLALAGCKRTPDDIAKWEANGNVVKLIAALDDPVLDIRRAATKALGNLKAESAVEPLAAMFSSTDAITVRNSVESLAAIGNGSAIAHLMVATNHDDRKTCILAITRLGQLKATQAFDTLCECLNHPDEQIARAAATALGQLGDPKAIAPLSAKVQGGSHIVRLASVKSLIQIGGPETTAGLVKALDDTNKEIRNLAVGALSEMGDSSCAYAFAGLRDNDAPGRLSATHLLETLNAVPTEGSNRVWYILAQVPSSNTDRIDPRWVDQLVELGDAAIPALLEALAHPASSLREHAFIALETLGEPAAEPAIAAAQAHAGAAGKQWFDKRTEWQGYPSWRIDLWAAGTALNPDFCLDPSLAATLERKDKSAHKVMQGSTFKGTREYVPLLIDQLGFRISPAELPEKNAYSEDPENLRKEQIEASLKRDALANVCNEPHLQTAMEILVASGSHALFPLIAALNSSDPQVADYSAKILGEIGDQQAVAPLAEKLLQKVDAGEHLSNSPFYTALQKLDDIAAEPALLKVRPNADQATRIFKRKHPGIYVTFVKSKNAKGLYSQPVGFTLGYSMNGQSGEARIVFKKDENGEWLPTPPLPDQLP